MPMPKQNKGKSEQVVQTPPEFIAAVDRVFGGIYIDLAANESNALTPCYYGPGGLHSDSLEVIWSRHARDMIGGRIAWCNPPYENIAPWVFHASQECREDFSLVMLVPASVGSNWYRDWVQPFADVYSVGRMKFVGHKNLYPKDLILAHYWKLGGNKFKHWDWRK